jgi:hypothetical protein
LRGRARASDGANNEIATCDQPIVPIQDSQPRQRSTRSRYLGGLPLKATVLEEPSASRNVCFRWQVVMTTFETVERIALNTYHVESIMNTLTGGSPNSAYTIPRRINSSARLQTLCSIRLLPSWSPDPRRSNQCLGRNYLKPRSSDDSGSSTERRDRDPLHLTRSVLASPDLRRSRYSRCRQSNVWRLMARSTQVRSPRPRNYRSNSDAYRRNFDMNPT